ncbi:hypothetical protein M5T12_10500 [Enterobacter asburiae]|uniref:hypothetical protein n=1 Tax=Enterobacter asburiae TaxID=61645 RepID=UPI002176344F|nr:hypothetical protein [Enterobacter asburiae]UWA77091.1 hypothetical protein M5T12_10500 [Enterobacter asburiae]
MSNGFPEWWKHGQKVRTRRDGILTLNVAPDAEYWLTNDEGKEVYVFSADILGPVKNDAEGGRPMSNINKQAVQAVADLKAGYTLGNADVEIIQQMALDAVTLLNELEKMQAQSSKWCEAFHKAVSVGARYEERIAELEAKIETSDKLQDSAFRHGLQHGFSLGQTDNQAGFEECLSAYGTGKGE